MEPKVESALHTAHGEWEFLLYTKTTPGTWYVFSITYSAHTYMAAAQMAAAQLCYLLSVMPYHIIASLTPRERFGHTSYLRHTRQLQQQQQLRNDNSSVIHDNNNWWCHSYQCW